MKQLIIRADMNARIATGHVMRCLSIADAAKEENVNVVFISADENGRGFVESRGYTYISLGTQWDQMEDELLEFEKIISLIQPDYILLDSYYVTEKYMKELRKLSKVAYIDDLCQEIYPCDTLICYANYSKKYNLSQRYSVKTQLLLGSEYFPLRKEFSILDNREISKEVKEILLLSGGADPYHFLKQFLIFRDGRKEAWKDIKIRVICGIYNLDYREILEKYALDTNTEVLTNVINIEKYMLQADIAISAGGTSLYELCACGTPTVCYSYVDNQLDNVLSFAQDNVMFYAGDLRDNNVFEKIIDDTELLMQDYTKRSEMSKKMMSLVDTQGASRIIRTLMTGIL